ncbi:RNA binding methyltransferase FtsJ like [hydrothermal vent metagenome]|uniref:RNA binding methyltransferase FtsJ like n=1 Tax=hydrothermal vent metagenome TaxID=652676 RepID=A0A3B1DZ03_9ZZZZ
MKERLDKLLLKKGLVSSRERAKALILEGRVLVNRSPVDKAGTLIDESAGIVLRGEDIPYASRGGLKLEGALEHFHIQLDGLVVMDVGASTGGFTDCMLQKGAVKVYAVDVGYGQLSWKLRKDPRVVVLERTNIRYLTGDSVPEKVDLVTIDVSFISLLKVVPKILEFLKDGGGILALIKPQFEVGKGEVDKGGVIKSVEKRMNVVGRITEGFESMGLEVQGISESPVKGQKGNTEYFIYVIKPVSAKASIR